MKPAAAERASRATVAGPHDEFRRCREAAGYTKKGLARTAGLSSAYVAQLERGNIANPSADARRRLAHALGVDAADAFAGFPASEADEIADRRRRVLELYNAGRSHRGIAAVLGVSESVVTSDLHSTPAYRPRPTRSTYRPPGGCVLASHAAAARGLDVSALCGAISRGEIPGGSVEEVAEGSVYVVDEEQLDAYIAARPECEHNGCSRQALVGSRACCGGHASGLATAGTKKSYETRTKMSASKKGKPRPDTRERIRAVFADPETKHEQQLKMQSARHTATPVTVRRRKRALAGVRGARAAGRMGGRLPIWETQPERYALLLRLRSEHGWGRSKLAHETGLTPAEVRSALDHHKAGC